MTKKRLTIRLALLGAAAIFLTAVLVVLYAWTAVGSYFEEMLGWGVAEVAESGTVTYFSTVTSSLEQAWEDSSEAAVYLQAEGSVLLENRDHALPLKADQRRISVFGTGSVNNVLGGTGSGNGNGGAQSVDLYEALYGEGFVPNEALHAFYLQKYKEGYRRGEGTDMNGNFLGRKGTRSYGYSVNEVERDAYVDVRQSYSAFSDVALVVISRSGGEGQDLPTDMTDFYENDSKHYLQLTDEEEDLLMEVKEGGFGAVVVLLNTLNAFDCSFLKEEKYGISAALWIGGTGQYGMRAVAQILTGKSIPCGRLSDTFAGDMLSAPAMMNYGDNRYVEDGKVTSAAYVAYAEGIYIGYRYYETRFFDKQTGAANVGDFSYEDSVVYPFGYGLGYTDFQWNNAQLDVRDDILTVTVTVDNVGDVPGKEVVQLYAHKPYTAHDGQIGLEKSAVELVGYAKTDLVDGGDSRTVTLTADVSQLASYDAYEKKTYRLDKGDYLLICAENAHDAVLKVLECYRTANSEHVLVYRNADDRLLDASGTGYTVTNRFETDSYTSRPADLPLLSRADWRSTFPVPYGVGEPGKAVKTLTSDIKSRILSADHLGPNDDRTDYVYDRNAQVVRALAVPSSQTDSGEVLNFIDAVGMDGTVADYDDPIWQRIVRCMSKEELYTLCSSAFGQIADVPSVNKRKSDTSDSPMGLHDGTLFSCYPIQASTWSTDVAERVASCIAEEALWLNIRQWYAPTGNTHRTPFGGRNFEYYSEDGVLAGVYLAKVVETVQSRGLVVQVKHFALNDQDTNRGDRGNFRNGDPYNGLCTYAGEQSIREIYLKPFQYAVEKGGAHGVMTSYNRIGETWAGGHYGLLTEVLRNEWGMQGNALTDYAGTFGYVYMNFSQGLRAGSDVWLHPGNSFPTDDVSSDAAVYYMQKAAKNILYAEACSSRVNNQRYVDGTSVTVQTVYAPWRFVVGLTYAALMLALMALSAASVVGYKKRKKAIGEERK